MMTNKKSVGQKILCKRINRYFYRDEAGRKHIFSVLYRKKL